MKLSQCGRAAALVLATGISGCTSVPETAPPEPHGARSGAIGQAVQVAPPLPKGDWRYVGAVASGEGSEVSQTSALWVSHKEGVVDRLVAVSHETTGGDAVGLCGDAGYLYSAIRRNPPGDQSCWHIRPVSLGLRGNPPAQNRMLAEYVTGKDLVWSPSMIGVRYVSAAGPAQRAIEYLYNPDVLAPAPGDRLWLPLDWARDSVASDPYRQAVISALRQWGERWSAIVLSTPDATS